MLVCNPPRLGGDHNQLGSQIERPETGSFIAATALYHIYGPTTNYWNTLFWVMCICSEVNYISDVFPVYVFGEFSLGKFVGKFSNAVRNWRCCWKQKLSLNGWLPKESSRARFVRCWGLSAQDPLVKTWHNHPRIPNDLWIVAWLSWLITLCKDILDWE